MFFLFGFTLDIGGNKCRFYAIHAEKAVDIKYHQGAVKMGTFTDNIKTKTEESQAALLLPCRDQPKPGSPSTF